MSRYALCVLTLLQLLCFHLSPITSSISAPSEYVLKHFDNVLFPYLPLGPAYDHIPSVTACGIKCTKTGQCLGFTFSSTAAAAECQLYRFQSQNASPAVRDIWILQGNGLPYSYDNLNMSFHACMRRSDWGLPPSHSCGIRWPFVLLLGAAQTELVRCQRGLWLFRIKASGAKKSIGVSDPVEF